MNRRSFLALATLSVPALFISSPIFARFLDKGRMSGDKDATTHFIYAKIIEEAKNEHWDKLPIGERVAKIAQLLLGTKYSGGTLEGDDTEVCKVDLTGLDCVTFFENSLCIARLVKLGKTTFDDLIAEVTLTRYRNGLLTDYTSRLHYTADWIYNNTQKKIVKDVSKELGGEKFPLEVSFMSKNPKFYPALKKNPDLVDVIAKQEEEINAREYFYIQEDNIEAMESRLQAGDIIAVATSKKGLDYAHTGLMVRDEAGKLRFMHASQKEKKVILDGELSKYVKSVKTHIGISIIRPLEAV